MSATPALQAIEAAAVADFRLNLNNVKDFRVSCVVAICNLKKEPVVLYFTLPGFDNNRFKVLILHFLL